MSARTSVRVLRARRDTDAVNGALNDVGGALGNPNLGDQVNGTLNGVTNGLLGGG